MLSPPRRTLPRPAASCPANCGYHSYKHEEVYEGEGGEQPPSITFDTLVTGTVGTALGESATIAAGQQTSKPDALLVVFLGIK